MKKLYALLHVYMLLTIVTCAGWFISCEEKEDFIPLKIFSIEPAEVLINDTILITGEGFSPGIEYNRVSFPGASELAEPLKISTEKKLWVVVPEGTRSGPVTVNIFDEEIAESPVDLTVMAPVVESIEPAGGVAGDTVIIRGRNFRQEPEKNIVRFNPADLKDPLGWGEVLSASSTLLKVIVPIASRTGKISVLGFEGVEFTVLPPSITGIEPLNGIVGDTIFIFGRGFGEAHSTNIRFEGSGNVDGTVLQGSTSRKLQVVIPEGAKDGAIKISYSSIDLISEQIFEVYPSVTSISPLNGISGMTVTISGYTFSDASADNTVKFGGLNAQVTSASATLLKAVVPAGTETGPVTVEVNHRVADGPVFEISADGTPLIFSILPASGPVGSLVSIKGDYFSDTASENNVRFGSDAQAEILAASKTQLTVKVPVGAVNGPVTVTKENKTGTGPDFVLSDRTLPIITSVTPELVEPGTNFTIHGGNFTTFPNDISIQSTSALGTGTLLKPLTASPTEITATLPANAKVGEWSIYVTQYNQNSNNDKTITVEGEPFITSLSASDGFANSALTLTGTEFHNIESKNEVNFGNASGSVIAGFVNESEGIQNQIQVVVPPGIAPGVYNVTVKAFGNTSNAVPFTVKEQPAQVKNIFYSRLLTSPTRVRIEKATPSLPIQTVYEATSTSTTAINSLVVDVTDSKVYLYLSTGIIMRSAIDNSNPVQLYSGQAASNDLTLDAANGKLYWSRTANIWRGDVKTAAEGGAAAAVIYTAASGTIIRGLTYSPDDNKVYFCELNSAAGAFNIASIDLDDTPPYTKTPVISGMTVQPLDVKIDQTNGKLFILCGPSAPSRRSIYMGALNGSPHQTLTLFHTIQGSTNSEPLLFGIALDTQDEYVYWLKSKDDVVEGPSGVYRKRYDQAPIPGTTPSAAIEKIYDIPEQTTSQFVISGLAIEDPSGESSSQRRNSGASQRGFSAGMTIELTNYRED
jgi:hypothetical protein